jgi:hypothetical protein
MKSFWGDLGQTATSPPQVAVAAQTIGLLSSRRKSLLRPFALSQAKRSSVRRDCGVADEDEREVAPASAFGL